jgi:hypothetical protein
VVSAPAYRATLERLEERALTLPRHSRARVAAYEEAIALADREGDTRAGWWLRQGLTEAVYHTEQWDALLPAFDWLLARADEDPARFKERNLLWKYKWVIRTVIDLPEVDVVTIERMLDDLEMRFRRSDASLRAVHGQRATVALELGDRDALQHHAHAFWEAPRDRYCDCGACEHEQRADFLEALGDAEFATRERQRLVEGRLRCAYVPDGTFSQMLPRLWRKGRVREAEVLDAEGRSRARRRRRLVLAQARHLAFAAARGELDDARGLLEGSWTAGRGQSTAGERLRYDAMASFGLAALARADKMVELPPTRPDVPAGRLHAEAVKVWLDTQGLDVARRFDARAPGAQAERAYREYGQRVWGM